MRKRERVTNGESRGRRVLKISKCGEGDADLIVNVLDSVRTYAN